MPVVASRFGTADNRAHKNKEWLGADGAPQCRRIEGNWGAQTTSTKGIRSGISTRGIAGAIRHAILVPTMLGRGEDYELRLALKPAHILLMVGDGRSIDQRDSGARRPQDDHDVCSLQSSLARTQAFRYRPDCNGKLNPSGECFRFSPNYRLPESHGDPGNTLVASREDTMFVIPHCLIETCLLSLHA